MSDPLEIRLLGPFEVIAGGRRVDIPGTKRQALLALLALGRGRVVAVDELVDVLWGADLPAAPRNAVQHHVARLPAGLRGCPARWLCSPHGVRQARAQRLDVGGS